MIDIVISQLLALVFESPCIVPGHCLTC